MTHQISYALGSQPFSHVCGQMLWFPKSGCWSAVLASKALVSLWGDKFPETARQKGALPTNPQDCSPYISLQNKSRENVSRSRHFPVGDHFLHSYNLFLWLCINIVRRKLCWLNAGSLKHLGPKSLYLPYNCFPVSVLFNVKCHVTTVIFR